MSIVSLHVMQRRYAAFSQLGKRREHIWSTYYGNNKAIIITIIMPVTHSAAGYKVWVTPTMCKSFPASRLRPP